MPIDPPRSKILSVGRARLEAQLKAGRSPEHVFVHIPKTGGSSVERALTLIAKAGGRPPTRFPPMIDLDAAEELAPDARFVCVLRDPLERLISAFNSRLRQGRPRYHSPWRPAEATVFAHYRRVEAFLDGLLSDDPFDVSMADFAFSQIGHLKRGYAFYFGDAEAAARRAERFALIGEMDRMEAFFAELLKLSKAPATLLPEIAPPVHAAPERARAIVAALGEEKTARLRRRLAGEYAVHDRLSALSGPR
ncbi:MAG: sulfotransferase [Pseudomonadota bacterium]